MLLTVGEIWIESPDRQAHIRPGDLFLLSLDEPFRGRATHHGGLSLTLPRDLFAAAAANFDGAAGDILTGPLAGLLVDYLRSLEARLIGMSPEDLVLVGRATAEMLAACVGPSRYRQEQARSTIASILFDRARSHIQAHFGDPELTPERVAQDLRVSRSNLYRVFEQAGGVSRYIQQCRLFAAHAALTGESGRRIQDIAYSCGFKLASDFTRAFRREFGFSPREARDAWRRPGRAGRRSGARPAPREWACRRGASLPLRSEEVPPRDLFLRDRGPSLCRRVPAKAGIVCPVKALRDPAAAGMTGFGGTHGPALPGSSPAPPGFSANCRLLLPPGHEGGLEAHEMGRHANYWDAERSDGI